MIRAGVFIGVDKTGGLQRLNDAASGAARMHEWVQTQEFVDPARAKLITDAGGQKVHPDLIYDAIKEILDGAGVDQLLIYFAGHGVNINRNEHWLLTEAPVKTSAAVNVTGSVELARYCGIQHVVIVSDACRVAPDGIQAQNVRGVDIFPNDAAADKSKPVDQFFACALGRTAAEIKDAALAADGYRAIYTSALLDALKGARSELLEASGADGDTARYVRPHALQSYLEREIPSRVKALQLESKVNQNPDAIITSSSAWLSKIAERRVRGTNKAAASMQSLPPAPPTLRSVAQELVRSAAGDQRSLGTQLDQVRHAAVAGAGDLVGTAERIAQPFGPDHFETQCGIKVRGERIVEFMAPLANGQLLTDELLRIQQVDPPAASVLLRFSSGSGAVIPAIPGFLAEITFVDGELVDVSYEPSTNSGRWGMFASSAQELRALRAIVASSSHHGLFRLDQAGAIDIAKRMQYAKSIDPTLAVYAAYAYHDMQEGERIRKMSGYLRDDVGATLFDLQLLGRLLIDKRIERGDRVVPFVPLLSQGYALLRANRVRLHPDLDGLESTLRDSLWSLFEPRGVEMLKRAMATGDLR